MTEPRQRLGKKLLAHICDGNQDGAPHLQHRGTTKREQQRGNNKEGTTKEGTTKEGTTKEGTTKEGTTKEGTNKEGPTKRDQQRGNTCNYVTQK